jgi:hypothetical protein
MARVSSPMVLSPLGFAIFDATLCLDGSFCVATARGGRVVRREDEYRLKAEDCVRFAEQSGSVVTRAIWLKLAEGWRKLANRAEATPPKPPQIS